LSITTNKVKGRLFETVYIGLEVNMNETVIKILYKVVQLHKQC